MTISKTQKNILITIGTLLSFCYSLMTLSRYIDIPSPIIYLISFIPTILIVIGLALILNRKKIGYWLTMIMSIYYFIRDIIQYASNKKYIETNPFRIPDKALDTWIQSYQNYVIICEIILFVIFLVLLFNKNIRRVFQLKIKNYLLAFGLFLGFLFAHAFFINKNSNKTFSEDLSPELVDNYPYIIDSVLNSEFKNYKNIDFKVYNPAIYTRTETDGKIGDWQYLIDTNRYDVYYTAMMNNDSTKKGLYEFEFYKDGRLKYMNRRK